MGDTGAGGQPGQFTVGEAVARMRVTSAIAGLGAVAVAAGSLGPWVTTPLGSVSGVHGYSDGWLTVCAGVVAIGALLIGQGSRWGSVMAWLALVGALALVCYDGARIIYATSKLTILGIHLADAGWGLYAVAAGAVLGALALSCAGVVTNRGSDGALLAMHDYRAGLVLLVLVAAAAAVAGGLAVEHERVKDILAARSGFTPPGSDQTPTPASPPTPDSTPTPGSTPTPNPRRTVLVRP